MRITKMAVSLSAIAVTAALALTGCSASSTDSDSSASATDSTTWPLTVTDDAGHEVTLDKHPERIVNTALSVTGTLLAIDAPVVATAATSVSNITDDKGFFSQWASVADERGVEVLYPDLTFDLESVIAADPDLIIVSTSGADSVYEDHYDELTAQGVPVYVANYGSNSWEDLALDFGKLTGHSADAQKAIDDFDAYAAEAADKITVPEGTTSIVSFNGAGKESGIAKKTSAQADILTKLGFDVVEADADLDTSTQVRQDFAFVTYENLSKAITGQTIFTLSDDGTKADQLKADATLANLDAVTAGQVYPLGATSFRIDPYSGRQVIDQVVSDLS